MLSDAPLYRYITICLLIDLLMVIGFHFLGYFEYSCYMKVFVEVLLFTYVFLLEKYLGVETLIRNYQITSHSTYTIPHFHQQYFKSPGVSHPCKHLVLSVFLILAIM